MSIEANEFWDIDQVLNFCLERDIYFKTKATNGCNEKEDYNTLCVV
tara:strand:- start:194 stop:331 length:138 start_codon:yes stop_codon:yes gene_type:complete